jgi:hypothetical protein
MTTHLNTPAHLVARALRARRTVTWQYKKHIPSGSWRFHGLTRSQILKDVRETIRTTPDDFRFGVEYEPSLDWAKLPNPKAYGLEAYAILPPPAPTPPPPTREQLNAELEKLYIERIAEAARIIARLNPALATAINQTLHAHGKALHTVTPDTAKTP